MRLDLSEILAHVGMRYTYPVDEQPIVDEDLECVRPITGSLVFANTGSVLMVDGEITCDVTLPCSRCLEYYDEPVVTSIAEQFPLTVRHSGTRVRPGDIEVQEEEQADAGRLFDGPWLDLTELLRQSIILCLPLQPLHDPNCAGLCARCGTNLNRGGCTCPEEGSNLALMGLGALLGDVSFQSRDDEPRAV